MKNINFIINGILTVAIVILFILHFTCNKVCTKNSEADCIMSDSAVFHLPVAYIRTDSLLANYKYFIDVSEEITKKIEDKKLIIAQRREKLNKDAATFEEKARYNAFMSTENQQQQYERLMKQSQEIENYAAMSERELAIERDKMMQLVTDTIVATIRQFNSPKKFEMIFSNAGIDNILYADDSYDITFDIVELLNSKYVPKKK